jgi:hypothetical protein
MSSSHVLSFPVPHASRAMAERAKKWAEDKAMMDAAQVKLEAARNEALKRPR